MPKAYSSISEYMAPPLFLLLHCSKSKSGFVVWGRLAGLASQLRFGDSASTAFDFLMLAGQPRRSPILQTVSCSSSRHEQDERSTLRDSLTHQKNRLRKDAVHLMRHDLLNMKPFNKSCPIKRRPTPALKREKQHQKRLCGVGSFVLG